MRVSKPAQQDINFIKFMFSLLNTILLDVWMYLYTKTYINDPIKIGLI